MLIAEHDTRIVSDYDPDLRPWLVLLDVGGVSCGGTIVNKLWGFGIAKLSVHTIKKSSASSCLQLTASAGRWTGSTVGWVSTTSLDAS